MASLREETLAAAPAAVLRQHQKLTPRIHRDLLGVARRAGRRTIVHVSATAHGGGVAELLRSQIPLERAFGMRSHWLVMRAPRAFFKVTKRIHNFLQGRSGFLSEQEKALYLGINRAFGIQLSRFCRNCRSPIAVVHDAQPLPAISALRGETPAIFRLHADISTPNPRTIDFLQPHIEQYDTVIVSSPQYLESLPWLPRGRSAVILPAIDPFSPKNLAMDPREAALILEEFGLNPTRPLLTQVSRFDPWKDPLGVLRAYYLAKNAVPELQLAMAGIVEAQDDPEQAAIFASVVKHARGDPDIFLFSDPRAVSHISTDVFVNAVYTASTVVIQNSLREGFGLTMTEALWKGKPLVARVTSGALLQVRDGKNGILVSSPDEAALAIVRLLKNERSRVLLGRAGHASVKRRFLISRYVLDNLRAYALLN